MKRCALIISDDPEFRDWAGCHITTKWPKMMIEKVRLANAAMYLDRSPIERYRLILVRLSFASYAEIVTCIFLMRILNLENHPDIIVAVDDPGRLKSTRATRLGEAACVLTRDLTSTNMQAILRTFAESEQGSAGHVAGGAPQIPGHTILEPLAGTYSATVYRAFSHKQGSEVALKICEVDRRENDFFHRASLREEYETLHKLGGEHVARAFEYGEIEDVCYLSLEFFSHGTITQYVSANLRGVNRFECLLNVARGLRRIHEAGFLHLDLKPNNVMIRDNGKPALIDFGISRRTIAARYQDRRTYSLGSPYFMSPEQIRGETLDERSDIYSFGALWFRVFTGQPPFTCRNFGEILAAHENAGVPNMGELFRHYQPIISGTLAPRAEDRFENAQALIEAIESCSDMASRTGRFSIGNRTPDSEELRPAAHGSGA